MGGEYCPRGKWKSAPTEDEIWPEREDGELRGYEECWISMRQFVLAQVSISDHSSAIYDSVRTLL